MPATASSYRQRVVLRFRTAAAARRARIRIASLYGDCDRAFATRMDDNNVNALRVSALMAEHGQKGTFYLNDPKVWWEDNADDSGLRSSGPGQEIPRVLLAAGHSIGGHTLNHDYLPALTKNAAFKEITAGRVALEVATQSPVVSFTYPFMYFRSPLRSGRDQKSLEEMLIRAGYLHLAEHDYNRGRRSGLEDAQFIVCDGSSQGGRYREEALLAATKGQGRLFLATMHPWARAWGGVRFPKLGSLYAKWSERRRWWYCNQNQYAAYRVQAARSRLSASRQDAVVTLDLLRPDQVELGDAVPLTLVVSGPGAAGLESANGESQGLTHVRGAGKLLIDIPHDDIRGPIRHFHEFADDGGRSLRARRAGPYGLQARLRCTRFWVELALRNDGRRRIEAVTITFRLPLAWRQGVERRFLAAIEPAALVRVRLSRTQYSGGPETEVGTEYCVAQIDYTCGTRARAYAACERSAGAAGAAFACRGFRVVGPLPGEMDRIDPQVFTLPVDDQSRAARIFTPPWGRSLIWRTIDPAQVAHLDPDIIPTTGSAKGVDFFRWHSSQRHYPHTPVHYILLGGIRSRTGQTVRAIFSRESVRHLMLNGASVRGRMLSLRPGLNRVCILYTPPLVSHAQFGESHYGCYFRLESIAGGRPKGIAFERLPRRANDPRAKIKGI